LIREQEIDPAGVVGAIETLLQRYETPAGVAMKAACWIVTAKR
jgi:hypothetical protein